MGSIKMEIAIISTCTNRKRNSKNSRLCASNLRKGDMQSVLTEWENLINDENNRLPACDLYCGRGFSEIRKTVVKNDLKHWIISAGLGLIDSSSSIPSYSLTITSSAADNIATKISPSSHFHPAKWWMELNKKLKGSATPLCDLINNQEDTVFIFSLSSAYLHLISEDLLQLPSNNQSRVRLTGICNLKFLPETLKHLWMPYDERFDGPKSLNPGTRSDFPQRVTRHFIEEVLPKAPRALPQEHAELVSEFLSTMPPPPKIKRTSMTDEGIRKTIKRRWNDANGSGTKMLRILRDKENIACEQGRFADLFKQVKLRMS